MTNNTQKNGIVKITMTKCSQNPNLFLNWDFVNVQLSKPILLKSDYFDDPKKKYKNKSGYY